jgi:hypothetical protein
MAAREVDDGQAAHPDDRVAAVVDTLIVGTAVNDLIGHTAHVVRREPSALGACYSNDAAHIQAFR